MYDLSSCVNKIEQQCQEMYRLAEQYGFSDYRVLIKSKQLDDALNEYHRCLTYIKIIKTNT